ncbi:MAG: YHS domain-containing protein [Acidobacteria bacterium]|nr:YHS domain-containing protein [Acidobacteriota bacterium]
MTTLIFRIALLILGVWVLWQILAIILVKNKRGRPASGKTSYSGKNMVKDPVCGMYMDPRLAVKHETKTGIFYFCSEECKNKFLNDQPGRDPDKPPSEE